jgi:hypothetical protein
MNEGMSDSYKKIVEREFPGFVQTLESCIDFKKWGFKQTFYGVAPEFAPSLIYNSDSCRARFVWIRGDERDGGYPTMHIKYGRLHASDNHRFILWDGQLSHCWHRIDHALIFLDGIPSQETVGKRFMIPYIKEKFQQLNKGQTWSMIEWLARQEAFIWDHYGSRLFNLFDLRHLEIWEQFVSFIDEFYKLNPGTYSSTPLPERIC